MNPDLSYEESTILFNKSLNEADARTAQKNMEMPYQLNLGNVNITRDENGNYLAIINGESYPATTDGGDGLRDGVFHFNLE